jgi:prepilin-type N-terminal cleavage/methylation domain-containing protein/prepilin-type processing-associated H-X9-DG protein
MFKIKSIKLLRFSLIELLVVISIISILVSFLFPALKKTFSAAQSTQCQSNLKHMGYAAISYTEDFDGFMTISVNQNFQHPAWTLELSPYLSLDFENFSNVNTRNTVLECPSNDYSDNPDIPLIFGGYAHNWRYMGYRTDLPQASYQRQKLTQVDLPKETISFSDGLDHKDLNNTSMINLLAFLYKQKYPWLDVKQNRYYRHLERSNLLWADAHVSSEYWEDIEAGKNETPSWYFIKEKN